MHDRVSFCRINRGTYAVDLLDFAVSVVGCLLGYSSCLVVWIPLFLDPSDGAFGRFDLAALCGCRTLNFCLFNHSSRRNGYGCLREESVRQTI